GIDLRLGGGVGWRVRPLVTAGPADRIVLAWPLGVEQVLVLDAIVDRLPDGFHRDVVLPGDFLGSERFPADRLAVENFCANATKKELPIARASLRLQELVFAV